MKYAVSFRSLARRDVVHAMKWYDSQHLGLGSRFSAEIVAMIARARENPKQFPAVSVTPEVRRTLLNHFPYRNYFILDVDAIRVIQVLHAARHNRHWRRKLWIAD